MERLPTTYYHGNNRKFHLIWLDKYPWLRYSLIIDDVFCEPCAILLSTLNRQEKGQIVNCPFYSWAKINETLSNHSKHQYN